MRSLTMSHRSMDISTPQAHPPRSQSSLSVRPPSISAKRHGTAAHEWLRRHEVPQTIHGGHRYKGTYKGAPIAADSDDFDLVVRDDGDDPEASFEGLDNVRGGKCLRNERPAADFVQLAVMERMSSAVTIITITVRPTPVVHQLWLKLLPSEHGRSALADPATFPPSSMWHPSSTKAEERKTRGVYGLWLPRRGLRLLWDIVRGWLHRLLRGGKLYRGFIRTYLAFASTIALRPPHLQTIARVFGNT